MIRKLILSLPTPRTNIWLKRGMVNLITALLVAALFTGSLLVFRVQFQLGTVLLIFLFIELGLAYTRGIVAAIVAAFVMCLLLDFLFVSPSRSLNIAHSEDAWGLLFFLIYAILLSLTFAQLHGRSERIRRQKEEEGMRFQEQLRVQNEEISRRDHQMSIFYNLMQATRDEKDLHLQLELIAHTIDEAFAANGLRNCLFHLPDVVEMVFLNTSCEQCTCATILSSDEKAGMMRVMQLAQPMMILDAPVVFHEKGNFVRRIVGSNPQGKREIYRYIYMVPLISGRRVLGESGQKVLGVMRVLIEDDGNLELLSLKKLLDMPIGFATSTAEQELLLKLLDHAVILIEQALIERGLMRQESMNRELQRRAEEVQSAILSSVSHDFHTPLAMIKGAASGLLDQEILGIEKEEHRQMLKDIVSEADWLERIVMKMLDLSLIEKGALTLERELYPFEGIYQFALELGHMRSLIKERCIVPDIPNDLSPVEVDPVLVGQVMVNLIENAIHHTSATTPIEVCVREEKQNLLVTVADHGPGIPSTELDRIFEKFYRVTSQTKESEAFLQHSGSGLGLAICRGYVQAHGGRIWAENREGGGAKFMFTLPLQSAKGAIAAYEENPRR